MCNCLDGRTLSTWFRVLFWIGVVEKGRCVGLIVQFAMLGMREETVVVEGVVAMVVALEAIDRQAVAGRSCLSIVATMLAEVAVYVGRVLCSLVDSKRFRPPSRYHFSADEVGDTLWACDPHSAAGTNWWSRNLCPALRSGEQEARNR